MWLHPSDRLPLEYRSPPGPGRVAGQRGRTQTLALQPDSPAVDLVGQGACPPPTTDQRGVGRPQEEACDSGAFELVQQPTPPDSDGDGVADTKDNCPEVANPDQVEWCWTDMRDLGS